MTEKCVCCGEVIPEGRQVCQKCEKQAACMHVWVFEGLEPGKPRNLVRMRCQICGATRTEEPAARTFYPPDDKRYSGLISED